MRAILKESRANYISLESLINVDFRKKYELPVFLIPQKKIAKMTAKITMALVYQDGQKMPVHARTTATQVFAE